MFQNGHTDPEHISPGLGHQLMTPGPISSGLVPQPPSPTPTVPPTKNDSDTLFCLMFDEYFNPSSSVAQAAVQDTPSTSISQTIKEAQSHVIPTSVEEDDHGIAPSFLSSYHKLDPQEDLTCYLPRACLMLALEGFPSSL
ncbi:hypothetical protein Tco_1288572 [Tanacetum coccineum]